MAMELNPEKLRKAKHAEWRRIHVPGPDGLCADCHRPDPCVFAQAAGRDLPRDLSTEGESNE